METGQPRAAAWRPAWVSFEAKEADQLWAAAWRPACVSFRAMEAGQQLGTEESFQVTNTLNLIRKEGKYVEGYDLQETNVSRPIFTKTTLEMAKLRSAMFGDLKLQFSPFFLGFKGFWARVDNLHHFGPL
jgi:hypothetical protein